MMPSSVFFLMLFVVECSLGCCSARSDLTTILLGGVLIQVECCSLLKDELSCDSVLIWTVWNDVLRSVVSNVVRTGVPYNGGSWSGVFGMGESNTIFIAFKHL